MAINSKLNQKENPISEKPQESQSAQQVIWVSGKAPRDEIIADIMTFVEQAKKKNTKKV
ncbi:MAG: hypothetical protein WCI84_03150 [Bacteroidota bacterium]